MLVEPDVAFVANLLGDPSRAAMCLLLTDGRAIPAGELARRAGISAQTASNHLAKLVGGGLIAVEQQGRWRYYRLANDEAAHAIEALAVVAPRIESGRPRRVSQEQTELYDARTCYRHLAGKLGVAVTDALLRQQWLTEEDGSYVVTPEGAGRLRELGIDVLALRRGRRTIARRCIDWSERRPHLAGPLGTALAELAFARDWIRRQKETRAVLLTPFGRAELGQILRVNL